jgi:hypothetical protein
MAWTVPRLWTTGELVNASLLNTHVRDNLLAQSTHGHTGVAGDGAQLTHASMTGQTTDDHHAEDHATRHEPGGADAMTVDAAAGAGSLRTPGTGAQQAAAGNHTH